MKYIYIINLLTIILLAACNAPRQSETQPPAPTVTTVAATASPTIIPSPEPTIVSPLPTPTAPVFESPIGTDEAQSPADPSNVGQPVIEFNRSGGFAGLNDTFLIYADGRVESDGRVTFQVAPEAIEAILSQAEAGGFFDLNESYLAKNTCCDRFTYQITLRHSNKENSVVTIDDADNPPDVLRVTLEAIDQLVSTP